MNSPQQSAGATPSSRSIVRYLLILWICSGVCRGQVLVAVASDARFGGQPIDRDAPTAISREISARHPLQTVCNKHLPPTICSGVRYAGISIACTVSVSSITGTTPHAQRCPRQETASQLIGPDHYRPARLGQRPVARGSPPHAATRASQVVVAQEGPHAALRARAAIRCDGFHHSNLGRPGHR